MEPRSRLSLQAIRSESFKLGLQQRTLGQAAHQPLLARLPACRIPNRTCLPQSPTAMWHTHMLKLVVLALSLLTAVRTVQQQGIATSGCSPLDCAAPAAARSCLPGMSLKRDPLPAQAAASRGRPQGPGGALQAAAGSAPDLAAHPAQGQSVEAACLCCANVWTLRSCPSCCKV